jgi:hypothetical protein
MGLLDDLFGRKSTISTSVRTYKKTKKQLDRALKTTPTSARSRWSGYCLMGVSRCTSDIHLAAAESREPARSGLD